MTVTPALPDQEIAELMTAIGHQAKAASLLLTKTTSDQKAHALNEMAISIRYNSEKILNANAKDMTAAKDKGLSNALLDRLMLEGARIEAMADGLETVAALPDPIGAVISQWDQPSGLNISRVRVPLGVIGIIYESRPNVTADAGALCLKSGNAVILRAGSESAQSSHAIFECLKQGLQKATLPLHAIQLIPTTDRAAVGYMLSEMAGIIDVIVPRGGKSLIARIQQDARVPVMAHLEGLCHIYVHEAADLEKAVAITVNAKLRRTGICGAAETLLIDRTCFSSHLKPILDALIAGGCEIRGDADIQAADARVIPATEEDWTAEYLDKIISVRAVDGVDQAIEHITTYGSNHTESIITEDSEAASKFLNDIDSAIVMHNASTQFADGGEFGMGAEIGIATGKLHARGPVGTEQLTSYKYVVRGQGTIRP